MKNKMRLTFAVVVLSLAGCHSRGLERLLGNDSADGGPAGPYHIVIQGVAPPSGIVRFSPALASGDVIVRVMLRENRELDTIASFEEIPRVDAADGRTSRFYTFDDGTSRLQVYNHAPTGSTYPDLRIEIYTLHPAGYHTIVSE
jgi:hypothetical protein